MSRDMFCPLCRKACRGDCAWLVYDENANRFTCAVASAVDKIGSTPTNSLGVSQVMEKEER